VKSPAALPSPDRLCASESGAVGRSIRPSVRPRHRRDIRICYKSKMHLDATQPLLPIVTLAAGVFLMIAPRVLSFAVAVYLIFVGLLGLNGIYHIIK
jgi:hypothetical protein